MGAPNVYWDELKKTKDNVKWHLRAINAIYPIEDETNKDRVLDAKELQRLVFREGYLM